MYPISSYTEAFDREHGFTEAEWLLGLRGGVGQHGLTLAPGQARVAIGDGTLQLHWQVLPPRAIGLARMPRLQVQYRFEGVPTEARVRFMRHFDLYTQRGGG